MFVKTAGKKAPDFRQRGAGDRSRALRGDKIVVRLPWIFTILS
jgi:hypothetical protein